MEIPDKLFSQILSQLDSYMLDDDLVECVERVIVALNRYRELEKTPLLMDEQTWSEETKQLEPCSADEILKVEIKLDDLKNQFEKDKWIN